MDGFPSNEPREMVFPLLLLYAAALYRIILEKKFLPGFGFVPNNEQIIDYLKRKRLDPHFSVHMIHEIDIYSCEPWDLLGNSGMRSKEPVLYIFSEPYYKYTKSKRAHRRTNEGYWKVTGQGSKIMAENSPGAIGSKRILSFYYRGSKTDWVMHEFYVEDDPRYKKNFVLCRVERKRDNKHGISINDEGQSNQQMVPYSGNHVTENTISEAVQQPSNNLISNRNYVTENIFSKNQQLASDHVISCSRNQVEENTVKDSQQQSSDHLISSSRNRVAENGFPESQVLPNHNMISYSRNHVAENPCEESQVLPNHNIIFSSSYHAAENASAESLLLPNYNMIPYSGNHVAENGTPEWQLLQSNSIISCSGNCVAENACDESQQPLHHNSISYYRNHVAENTSDAGRLLLAASNACSGYKGLNSASYSALQSPIYSEQGSSYSNCSNNGGDLLNSQFDSKLVDYPFNSQGALQNTYSCKESGQTSIPHCNSSKPDEGVYVKDGCEMDVDAWVNELSKCLSVNNNQIL